MKKMKRTLRSVVIVAPLLLLFSCWGLPSDFKTLGLEEQVKAYKHHIRMGGVSKNIALSYISWHGRPAAQRMIPFLQGAEKGFSRRDALEVIWSVQARGCDLRGDPVVKELAAFMDRSDLKDYEESYAQEILQSIAENRHFRPGQLDSLKDGPCEREYSEKQAGSLVTP